MIILKIRKVYLVRIIIIKSLEIVIIVIVRIRIKALFGREAALILPRISATNFA